jgi:hypothetical protein
MEFFSVDLDPATAARLLKANRVMFTKALVVTWRVIWLPPMLAAFFLLALILLVRNGKRDAVYLLELL